MHGDFIPDKREESGGLGVHGHLDCVMSLVPAWVTWNPVSKSNNNFTYVNRAALLLSIRSENNFNRKTVLKRRYGVQKTCYLLSKIFWIFCFGDLENVYLYISEGAHMCTYYTTYTLSEDTCIQCVQCVTVPEFSRE